MAGFGGGAGDSELRFVGALLLCYAVLTQHSEYPTLAVTCGCHLDNGCVLNTRLPAPTAGACSAALACDYSSPFIR
jgi:hypothetical protein